MKIFIDYDSTLNNLGEEWCKWLNKTYVMPLISLSKILHWNYIEETYGKDANKFWQNPNIYENDIVIPIEGANEFINWLLNNFGEENIFISTTSWPTVIMAKNKHIYRHFGIPSKNIIHTNDKVKYSKNGILIDDNIANVVNHCKINKDMGIVFNKDNEYSWNKIEDIKDEIPNISPLIRFTQNYDEIKRLLR